jgi:hypothetical protein
MLLQSERHTLDKNLASKSINELTYIADCSQIASPGALLTAC